MCWSEDKKNEDETSTIHRSQCIQWKEKHLICCDFCFNKLNKNAEQFEQFFFLVIMHSLAQFTESTLSSTSGNITRRKTTEKEVKETKTKNQTISTKNLRSNVCC